MTVHDRQVADWPKLKVVTHIVDPARIYPICAQGLSTAQKLLGAMPLACSGINFETGECHVFITETTTGPTVEHELAHCEGWDHGGVFERAYAEFKLTGRNPGNGK